MSYQTTISNYVSTIGALAANTKNNPYDVIITDGENLRQVYDMAVTNPSAKKYINVAIDSAQRYVNISFSEAVNERTNLHGAFSSETDSSFLVSCDMSQLNCQIGRAHV